MANTDTGPNNNLDLSTSIPAACHLDITPKAKSDRFSLMQDLLAISHPDDTITLSVRLKRTTGHLEVLIHLRAHSNTASDVLHECFDKINNIARHYEAVVVTH